MFGQGDKTANEFCFVHPAWLGGFALATFAGPAGLADQDVLGGELVAKYLTHLGDMLYGLVNTGRVIFPVRQQVNGQEVHRRSDFRVLQPELPDVCIGDRLLDLAFYLVDQPDQLWRRDFLAQQGFVADDHRTDHVRVGIGRSDQGIDFLFGGYGVAADPGAGHQLEAVLACQLWQGFKARLGIGANALKARGQQRQVSVHPLSPRHERLVER